MKTRHLKSGEEKQNHVGLAEQVRVLESRLAETVTCESFLVPITTFEPELTTRAVGLRTKRL